MQHGTVRRGDCSVLACENRELKLMTSMFQLELIHHSLEPWAAASSAPANDRRTEAIQRFILH
jgi:hypothetical protein